VTDPNDVETAIKAIQNELGPIHTVIYNVGNGFFKTWDVIELSEFDLGMKSNFYGLLKVTQLVAPGMVERGEGAIMVTGATSSLRGKPFTVGFAPPKGAQR
jgi:NADP-dependent 3-hydroxy acid dehydrogenase YdfG